MENRIDLKKLILVLISFTFFIFFPNFIKYIHGCFNTWDLGIFVEAIQKISFSDLNPLINSYGFKIFNDHFDPILILPSFLNLLMPTSLSLLMLEIAFVILSIMPIYLLNRSGKLEKNLSWFFVIYLMINKASITALYYPVHPTTWSVAVLSFMFYFLIERWFLSLFFSTLLLFLFKEEFPFIGIMVSIYFLYENRKNKLSIAYFISMLVISIMWLIFAIKLRPIWFGGAFNDHGGNFLRNLFSNPLAIFKEYDFSKIKFILFCFLPLGILGYLNKFSLKNIFWQSVFISLPMIALRLLSGKFGFQYTAPFMIPFVYLFMSQEFKLSKKQLAGLITVMLLLSGTTMLKEVFYVAKGVSRSGCMLTDERRNNIAQIVKFDYSSCHEVYATGGAAFTLSTYKIFPKVVGPIGSQISKDSCLVLDLKSGDPYPRTSKEVLEYKSTYKEIISNSDFTILKTN